MSECHQLHLTAGTPPQEIGQSEISITATLEEKVSFFHTGVSLVCVIAPNGHVWGKRVNAKSGQRDVELEIFAPQKSGCRIKKGCEGKDVWVSSSIPLNFFTLADSTQEQRKKIQIILSEKEKLQYLLGTLMVTLVENLADSPMGRYARRTDTPKINVTQSDLAYSIKVVDCSEKQQDCEIKKSDAPFGYCRFYLSYAQPSFSFVVHPARAFSVRDGKDWPDSHTPRCEGYWLPKGPSPFPRVELYVIQAAHGRFDMSSASACKDRKLIQPSIRIMYGEYDFFDYFDIDDAALILQEERTSEEHSKLHWTLGIAKSEVWSNLQRIQSNHHGQ